MNQQMVSLHRVSKMDIVERVYKKIDALLIDDLKLGLPKTDSISIFAGLYAQFLSYYKTFQEVKKDREKIK